MERVAVKAASQLCNLQAERRYLCGALRRAAIRWPLKEICDMNTMPLPQAGAGEGA